MNAIGMIETKGFLAAVEGADVMLKTADVSVLSKSSASGGLITITVTGEVSAVQTAVEVAADSICRLGPNLLISKHVIARPSATLESIILPATQTDSIEDTVQAPAAPEVEVVADTEPSPAEPSVTEPSVTEPSVAETSLTKKADVKEEAPEPKPVEVAQPHYSESRLKRMKLNHLRKMVSELSDTKVNIDLEKATKKELIKVICDNQIKKGHK
ncbi:BMC domain-containing protein [Vibrio sp. HN007]|uniref:BMC domain-containing protein n=1 Tax=Vibrio iocasae TaxID=3098914 RepID=UPI0035D3FF67